MTAKRFAQIKERRPHAEECMIRADDRELCEEHELLVADLAAANQRAEKMRPVVEAACVLRAAAMQENASFHDELSALCGAVRALDVSPDGESKPADALRAQLTTIVEQTAAAQREACAQVLDGVERRGDPSESWAPGRPSGYVRTTPLVSLEMLPQEKPPLPSEEPGAEGDEKHYAKRRPWELEPHYSAHVAAMTSEGLHSKADIAAELAFRDARIRELTAELAELCGREEPEAAWGRAMHWADQRRAMGLSVYAGYRPPEPGEKL